MRNGLERMENLGRLGKRNFFALEIKAGGWIGGDTNDPLLDFNGKVKIAQRPGDPGRIKRFLQRDFHDRLRRLPEYIVGRVIFQDHVTIMQVPLEVETKLGPILGHAVPATLRQRLAIDFKLDPPARSPGRR